MPYVVFVASDVYGTKVNLELEFPYAPTVAELTAQVERAFTAECTARRPGLGPYQVAKIHVVDEVSDDWVPLTSPHQLRNYCQAYAFQPHSTRYTETQGHIPPAVKARVDVPSGGSPAPIGGSSPIPVHSTHPNSVAYASHQPQPHISHPGCSPRRYSTGASAGAVSARAPPQAPSAPSGAASGAARGVPQLPEAPPYDEKVRLIFENLDTNRNRVLEPDELRRGFRITGLDFTAATTDELFRKADVDRDGVVSFAEWQRFCELYPTLTDSVYFRLKAHFEHAAQEQACLDSRNLRPGLEEAERRAKAAYDQSQLDADDASRRLSDADRGVADAAGRHRAAEDAVREGQRGVDRARQQRAERERELAAERERERQSQLRAQDSAREIDGAQRHLADIQAALAGAEAHEQRIQQELADAQREVARQRQAAELAAADLQRAQDRHNAVLGELPRGAEDAAAALAAADQELAGADAAQRDVGMRAHDAAAAAAELGRVRDDAARLMQQLRDAQEPARLGWLDAQRELEDHDRRVADMEAALAADADRRRAQDDAEKGLVEQEIRLREQRETLEEKEGALRQAHSQFFKQPASGTSVTGASPRNAPSTSAPGGYYQNRY